MARDWSKATIAPAYIQVWEQASKTSPFKIPLKSRADAIRLRQKLYETRKILEANNNDLWPLIKGMAIYLIGDTTLSIESAERNIKEALADIGIGAMEAPDLEL